MSKYRRERVSERIKEVLARELATFRDPRLQFLTVTEVRVTGDLKIARVYWSVPADVENIGERESAVREGSKQSLRLADPVEDATVALRGAASALRTCLAKELTLRIVPQIEFIFDDSAIYGAKIDRLLSKLAG